MRAVLVNMSNGQYVDHIVHFSLQMTKSSPNFIFVIGLYTINTPNFLRIGFPEEDSTFGNTMHCNISEYKYSRISMPNKIMAYPSSSGRLQHEIFRMTRLLLLVAGLAVAGEGRRIQINEEVESLVGRDVESLEGREGRGLADWFGWGGSQVTEAPVRRIQGLQRRISQVEVTYI